MAGDLPQAVLFACGLNSVRSPMAAALFKHLFGRVTYVGSAGVRKGELDPFAVAAMEEMGLDIAGIPHKKGGVAAGLDYLAESLKEATSTARV